MSVAPKLTDEQIEQTIGNLLRVGLLLSTALVVLGAVIYLINHGSETPEYRVFHGIPADLRGLPGIVDWIMDWRGRGFIQLGLVVLLATPVLRVAFSVAAFALQRDSLYVAVTLLVLGVLLYSIAGGYR